MTPCVSSIQAASAESVNEKKHSVDLVTEYDVKLEELAQDRVPVVPVEEV